jgi:hypothetical protein
MFENKPTGWYVFTREGLHCQWMQVNDWIKKFDGRLPAVEEIVCQIF